jgi:PAS domain S-box-containing protein
VGAITSWNAAAEFLLGWTPEEAVGRPLIQTIVPGRYRDEYGRRLQRLHTVDEEDLPSGPVEMTAQDRSGREIAVELTISRMRWADGWRFYAFLRNVTERRAMARELETSETLHRRLAEHSGDLISRHGLDGRLVYVSPASTELLGLTPAELLGMNARQLVHPDDLKELPKIGVEFDDTGERSEVTFRLGHRNGHWVWVEAVRSVLRDDQGKATEVQLTTRNITDRKAREAASQQASRLESLGRLSAGLAHEINSPIQYVGDNARFLARAYEDLLGLVSRYRQVLDGADPASHEAPLAAMREAEAGIEFDYLRDEIPIAVNQTLEGIDRVATIVRAMKTFSHPGGSDHAPADLNEALTATVTVTRPQVNGVADLRMELADLPPVLCDIAELNQAFLNLIINAADAIEGTGKRGTIHLTSAVGGEHVTVRIRDTGTGIPDDVLPNIFEPFFTTKAVGRGSGQGLALTRAVVEGHGGTLTVDSRPGDGTTFTVRLPIDGCQDRPGST